MTQFLTITITSTLRGEAVCNLIVEAMPNFSWRHGNNDTQGDYVSGASPTGEQIQCWVDNVPMAFTVSFRSSSLDEASREKLIQFVLGDLIPRFGQASEVRRK